MVYLPIDLAVSDCNTGTETEPSIKNKVGFLWRYIYFIVNGKLTGTKILRCMGKNPPVKDRRNP